MRAAILGGIAEQPVEERVLWRIETDEPRRPAVIVLSRSRPSWEHLVEQAGWPGAEFAQATTKTYRSLLDRLADGEHYVFRLTANPIESKSRDAGRSARLGHRTVEHQLRWLTERAAGWGFDIPESGVSAAVGEPVPDVAVIARNRSSFARGPKAPPVTLQVVTYQGRLVIRDVSILRTSMLDGMGPAKAYGCGLLTLAPLESGRG